MTTTPEQLAKSQQAFHQHFKDWGEFAFCQDDNGYYTEEVTIKMFADWKAAEAFARKQALEEVYAIYEQAQELSHVKDGLRELLK